MEVVLASCLHVSPPPFGLRVIIEGSNAMQTQVVLYSNASTVLFLKSIGELRYFLKDLLTKSLRLDTKDS